MLRRLPTPSPTVSQPQRNYKDIECSFSTYEVKSKYRVIFSVKAQKVESVTSKCNFFVKLEPGNRKNKLVSGRGRTIDQYKCSFWPNKGESEPYPEVQVKYRSKTFYFWGLFAKNDPIF